MKQQKTLIDDDGEVRELTDEDFARARPLAEVMPPEFVQMVIAHQREMERLGKIKVRGKQKSPTKESVTLRLSPEVVKAFRATGKGWQTRINEVLLQHIQTER
ncbi:toxin-antitoxin system, antitoxin component [Pasteurellaceae bacterium 15-036681]|nr:toxin-antitoxin system, antitoxin component [Pasteurellaceae bacterium 15-036681]